MPALHLDEVTFTYPRAASPSLTSISLSVEDGEMLTVVGPSGCGKTTLLRLIAGLEPVDSGRIVVGDDDVTDISPQRRDVALVSQKLNLYPHMSVRANIGFALKMAKLPASEATERVDRIAELLGLTPLLGRAPSALSGGQRQRVAMARALVRRPRVFLMDEPMSNLDAQLRAQTRTAISALQRKLGVTTVYITHDQTEALTLGDRIAVMKDGSIEQIGTAAEIYDAPQSLFVAGFMGTPSMNLLPPRDGVVVGFRPEQAVLSGAGEQLTVELVEHLGSAAYAKGRLSSARFGDAPVAVQVPTSAVPTVGGVLLVDLDATPQHRFSAATGQRIP